MSRHRIVVGAAAAVLAIAACSEEDRADLLDDAVETAVRNFVALQGAEQLNAAGYGIDGVGLTCTAEVAGGGLDGVDVECTGATAKGADVVLRGTTSELPGASITELKGSFTATVDGVEVLQTGELGG